VLASSTTTLDFLALKLRSQRPVKDLLFDDDALVFFQEARRQSNGCLHQSHRPPKSIPSVQPRSLEAVRRRRPCRPDHDQEQVQDGSAMEVIDT